jgi:prepilin-type N-terminal cleavage/methylation domain-containing protein
MKLGCTISPARACRQHGSGFTLTEVLIATAIMGLVFLGLFGGISYGFAVTRASRETLRATQIILERMEGIRLYTFDQLTSSNMFPTTFTADYFPFTLTTNESKGITYYGRITFSDPETYTYYNPNLRIVTVTLNWTNSFGSALIPRSRSMQTLVGRWGIQNYTFFN